MAQKSFEEHALEKMQELMDTAQQQCGTEYQGDKTGLTETNCILFVTRVIAHAFEQTGRSDVAREVLRRKEKGTELARYLVNQQLWKAHFFSPDPRNPSDSNPDQRPEHSVAYRKAVESRKYYDVPVDSF